MLTPEEINDNWNKMLTFLERLGSRAEIAINMANIYSEHWVLAPASGKKEYHSSYPGGLVQHSLNVLANAVRINSALGWNLSKESIIISAIFHDVGKIGQFVGDNFEPYYVPQIDQWRKEKLGEYYTFNPKLPYMLVPDRSLFLCQKHGLILSYEETLAIKLHDGYYMFENKAYHLKEPSLATVLMMSDYTAAVQEKNVSE